MSPAEKSSSNPFLEPYGTPFDVPAFDRIQPEHFPEAFDEGMKRHKSEIQVIVDQQEPASFDNTIRALDDSGQLLTEVRSVFTEWVASDTNDALEAISSEYLPKLAAHRDAILLDEGLFQRVKAVYDGREQLNLDDEQNFLLENLYGDFVRSGAMLDTAQQARLKAINEELSRKMVKFGQNLLAETNGFQLVITDSKDLAGLPDSVIEGAAEAAQKAGVEHGWVFTTHKPSMLPFLTYAENRDLRRKLYQAYITRGDQDNEYDNKALLKEIVNLRLEKAQLLGYESYADFVLERRMAGIPERVYELLDRLWEAALPNAIGDREAMQAIIDAEGRDFKLASWDWRYYAEKLRKQKYDLDDSQLRPYFPLTQVRDGAFWVANQLYGITVEPVDGLPKPNPEAQVFEIKDADGSHLAILYMDFHPRASKRQGAWCDTLRSQSGKGEAKVDPIIHLVCNFTKPSGQVPSLLSLEEVTTLFHEFGHGLDAMFSDVTFHRLYRSADFSELPSQIMEHWAMEPEVLKHYARHHETGEVIPDALIKKIQNSSLFNQGFDTVEYLAASYLDMKLHSLTEPMTTGVREFESAYLEELGLIPEIISRYRCTYFAHIMGGYAAGYFGYIWSGVLDNDAFEAFKEKGLFDQETAQAFRKSVLARNGAADFDQMYVDFRGRAPKIEPLLRQRGLI